MDTEVASVKCTHAHKSSESKRTSRLVRNPKLTEKDQEKSQTQIRERDEQGEDRNQERFGEEMVYSEKHPHEGKAQRQVDVEAHHEEGQDCESRGQENFKWNTDLIETKKLENICQVAQDLYNGDAQLEPRGAHEEQHCRSLHETLEWLENAFARMETWTSNLGWYEW